MKGVKRKLKEQIALLRIKQGDSEAFGYIHDQYHHKIYRYIYFRISDKGTAYDLTQEVFLQTWEYIASHKTVDNMQAFLYRVAYHKVIDHYRMKEKQAVLIDDISETRAQGTSVSETAIELHFLKKYIRSLKTEYQDVIVLKHMEGLSIRDIAKILGKDPNNIRVIIHRAMTNLKALYKKKQKNNKHKDHTRKNEITKT
jgi:RNA polymerase sigma-70 factor, ECF subfamily